MSCRVFPGTRNNLHSFLDDAGYSYIGTLAGEILLDYPVECTPTCMGLLLMILADKDDLFAKSSLLEGKYKFDREEVSEEEWPEFSFWEGDQVKAEKKRDLLVNTEKQRINEEVIGKEHVGTSPNNCWSKAVASGKTFTLLKNTFWHCWLTGAL